MNPELEIETSAGLETATDTVGRINSEREAAGFEADAIGTTALESQGDIELPPVTPSVGVDGLLGGIENTVSDTQNTIAEEQAEIAGRREETFTGSLEDFLTTQLTQDTEGQITQEQFDKEGVDAKKLVVNRQLNKITSEQVSLRRKTERLEKNKEGLFGGALNDRIRDAQVESSRKQADDAVVLMALQGDYEVAKDIADRAIDAQMERQENELSAKKFIAEINLGLFTAAEARQFQASLKQEEREFNAEKDDKKTLQEVKLNALRMAQTNGAPPDVLSAIQGATTPEEVLEVGGQWGAVDLLDRARIRSTMANQTLDRKIKLIKAALEGDEDSIAELGYDPRDKNLTTEELNKNTDAYRKNQQDINRVNEMFINDRGLQAVSGGIRSPILSGLVSGGEAKAPGDPTGLSRFVPVVGNIQGAVQSRNAAASFLADANFITTNLTLDKFLNLKAQGATFGAMSEEEWRIIGAAADELSAMSITEGGQVIGFSVPEHEVREQLAIIQREYAIVGDRLNATLGLSNSEGGEIDKLFKP